MHWILYSFTGAILYGIAYLAAYYAVSKKSINSLSYQLIAKTFAIPIIIIILFFNTKYNKQLYFSEITPLWSYIVINHINAITISQYLNKFITDKYPINHSIIENIISIIKDIHKKGIIHRDIKPDNILINPDTYKITVIDFGLSIYSNDINTNNMNEFAGAYHFACPEMFKGVFYNASCDTWSIGVLCYLLITRKLFRNFTGGAGIYLVYFIK
mgnify:CR=1 FL=1